MSAWPKSTPGPVRSFIIMGARAFTTGLGNAARDFKTIVTPWTLPRRLRDAAKFDPTIPLHR